MRRTIILKKLMRHIRPVPRYICTYTWTPEANKYVDEERYQMGRNGENFALEKFEYKQISGGFSKS